MNAHRCWIGLQRWTPSVDGFNFKRGNRTIARRDITNPPEGKELCTGRALNKLSLRKKGAVKKQQCPKHHLRFLSLFMYKVHTPQSLIRCDQKTGTTFDPLRCSKRKRERTPKDESVSLPMKGQSTYSSKQGSREMEIYISNFNRQTSVIRLTLRRFPKIKQTRIVSLCHTYKTSRPLQNP